MEAADRNRPDVVEKKKERRRLRGAVCFFIVGLKTKKNKIK
jgi:hypothetical protein